MVSTIGVWSITENRNTAIRLKDESSLDAITRQLPDGYYSTFRTYAGGTRVLGLTAHLKRLYHPVSTPDVGESMLRQQLSELLEAYRPGEARVRTIMTKQGQAYFAIAALVPLPHDVYDSGVHVETTELQRESPRLKSTAFIGRSDSERKHLAREGIFEALLVKDGKILEGMTSNFFYVEQAGNLPHIGTSRAGILLGVTRETVIEIARGVGLEVKYEPLALDRVREVSEAFITSSSRGIVPVVQINRATIGQGSPGQITQQLRGDYESYVIANAEKI